MKLLIDFVGPEITLPFQSAYKSANSSDSDSGNISYGYSKGYLMIDYDLEKYDVLVLFNPGLAHPNLCDNWINSLKLLKESLETSSSSRNPKSLLITCHSEIDFAKDYKLLASIFGVERLTVSDNPFHSRRGDIDRFSERPIDGVEGGEHIVAANVKLIVIK